MIKHFLSCYKCHECYECCEGPSLLIRSLKIIDTSNKNTAVKISPFNLWFVSSFLIHDPTPPPPTALLYKVITVNIVLLVPWLKMGSPSLIQYENIIFLRRKKDFKSDKRSFCGEKKTRIIINRRSQKKRRGMNIF